MAGDLALAGHDVSFMLYPDQSDCLEACRAAGGIRMGEPAGETISGKSGLGVPRILTDDPAEALAGADLVVMDVVAAELETRAAGLIPHLENGQVLHVNTYGYWPGFRLAKALREADKAGVTVTESIAPTISANRNGADVTPRFVRRTMPVSAFPANRTEAAMEKIPAIVKSLEICRNVVATNFENINMLIHPAMALLNVGYFDRSEAEGKAASFYGTGNTQHAGKLAESLSDERHPICEAYGVRYRSVLEHIHGLYGGTGESVHEAVGASAFYREVGDLSAGIWRNWLAIDLPQAQVPFVLLAENAKRAVPLHRGFVDIAGALLDLNLWEDGLTLERLGIHGLAPAEITAYAETGKR